MKLVSDYLERTGHYEQLAQDEKIPEFKAQLLKQADAYRKLSAERTQRLNLQPS
jgi:hypothetical protein